MVDATDHAGLDRDEALAQAARLRQVLRWVVIMCGVLTPVYLVVAHLFNQPIFLIVGAIALVAGSIGLVSLWLLRRGQLQAAVLTLVAMILALGVGIPRLLPVMTPALTMTPLLAAALLLPHLGARPLRYFCAGAVLATIAIILLGRLPPLVSQPPPLAEAALGVICMGAVASITLLLLWQFRNQITHTLGQSRAAHAALGHAYAELERQVAVRTADLQAALAEARTQSQAKSRLLDEVAQQRALIREMSVPVLPISASALVIPLIGTLDDERLQAVQEQALQAIGRQGARFLLLDVTGVAVMDTQVAQALGMIVQAVRLLGAEVVLVGIRPEVAQAVVGLGIDLGDVVTQQSLRQGIAYTFRREGLYLSNN